MIAALTGTSRERLIVFHNWIAWAMFVLALIHTFPFIVYHHWKGDMAMQWQTSVEYWTGALAIVAQAYLTFMSVPWIRKRFYEFFKATHYVAALVFVVFFFLHCDFRLSSWDYFIATGVLYSLSWLYNRIRTYFEHGLNHRAWLSLVSETTVKVVVPTDTTWTPGQHIFARFLNLGLHSLAIHPFTICSVPSRTAKAPSRIVFYVKARRGFTRRLASLVASKPGASIPVLLDGPHGGIKHRQLCTYDRSLIVAGGSGAGLTLGFVMEHILGLAFWGQGASRPRRSMRVVLATRDVRLVEYYRDALTDFLEEYGFAFPVDAVDISIYLTGSSSKREKKTSSERPGLEAYSSEIELGNMVASAKPYTLSHASSPPAVPIRLFSGRPDIRLIAQEATLEQGVDLGMVVCGPAGMVRDVQDEAAAAQLRIMAAKPGAREVYLHSEMFSW